MSQAACGFALRLGTRLIKGLREPDAHRLRQTVTDHGPFPDIESLWHAAAIPAAAFRRLASADAFTSMGLDRQRALWQVRKLRDMHLPLFDDRAELASDIEDDPHLPAVPESHQVLHDYIATTLSLKSHPMSFLRSRLDALGVTVSADLSDHAKCPDGKRVSVAGLVLVRQRPGTASGIVFITLEDEAGIVNLIVRARVFDRYRKAAAHSRIMLATGAVERDSSGRVVHVLVRSMRDIGRPEGLLRPKQRNFH
jgi:error-prone DNA polymerase